MPANLVIRSFEPTEREYEEVIRIYNSVFLEYRDSVTEMRQEDAQYVSNTQLLLKRYVALEPKSQKIVAYAQFRHDPTMFHPQKFWVSINVEPPWQRCGIGTKLWEHLHTELKAHDASLAWASAREIAMNSLSFLHTLGFTETLRAWESRLYVDQFDFAPFSSYLKRLKTAGVTISTLAVERQHDPNCVRKFYELHIKLREDVPQPAPYTPYAFELFVKRMVESPRALPDAFFVAVHEGTYIGESILAKSLDEPHDLYQQLTGVRREYRRHGIAMALKLKAAEFAQTHGYKVIKTWNESNNVGMLSINQKLGFVCQPAWITFAKAL